MTQTINPIDRCRIVLIMREKTLDLVTPTELAEVLEASDVASIIFSPGGLDTDLFQSKAQGLVEAAQSCGVAAIVEGDSQVAGRIGADGLQLGQDVDALKDAIAKHGSKMMIASGNVKTRHNALVLGELDPAYVMFGKPGGDTHPEPHPKNIDLGQWWSSMVEVPCIVLGGTDLSSALTVANAGADFVALESAIFTPDGTATTKADILRCIKDANELLDEHAPPFEVPET